MQFFHTRKNRQPRFCRPEAYEAFLDSLSRLDSTEGLWDAAVAVSQHALDDLDLNDVRRDVARLIQRIENRLRSRRFDAVWTRLHQVLFDEEGFGGSGEHYYSAVNSYLPVVLKSHRGLPITLSLVYKVVAEGVGLRVSGVNAPGHFLVRVHDGPRSVLVDPFARGQILTTDEALQRVGRVVGAACSESCLATASHREWLARIIRNLQHLFDCSGRLADLEAMNELAAALKDSAHSDN